VPSFRASRSDIITCTHTRNCYYTNVMFMCVLYTHTHTHTQPTNRTHVPSYNRHTLYTLNQHTTTHCTITSEFTTLNIFSRYGQLKAEVTNCTPDDGHVWCPKHVEAIKLHILFHLVGSLPFNFHSFYRPRRPVGRVEV
jgi:hypothetical protein